jgi:aspartate kinase
MTDLGVLVQKFGGTSVSTPERRQQVVAHVRRAQTEGYQVAIVVSAMGRRGDPYATDTLLDLLRADGGPVDSRDYDLMFTCGETISVALMSHTLRRAGIPAVGLTSAQAGIFTDGCHLEAQIVDINVARMRALLDAGEVPVVTGGQGVSPCTLDYTTLGRGGSDTSGVAVGVALGAQKVDIFTDVEGVAVTDPRIVPRARLLRQISYARMYEMARFGAKVVHPRALRTAWASRIPVVVRSTFSAAPGTVVADVQDERSVVGLAALSPMRTVRLLQRDLPPDTRTRLEDRRLILSIVDAGTGGTVLGAPPDKSEELELALVEAGDPLAAHLGDRCWISIVGDGATLRKRLPEHLTILEERAVHVAGYESTGVRTTLIVDATNRDAAVNLLYDSLFG